MKLRRTVLAVLPFQTTSGRAANGSEGDAVIAQGLLEDVCGELARFPTLEVISWMSGLAVADLPDQEVGRRLGATHVLRSRLRRIEGGLRITASLIGCSTGTQLWSERFEAPEQSLFDVQEEVVARIAATLTRRLEETALRECQRRPTESLAAYGLSLRGLALLRQGTLEADEEARRLFQRALELEPHYARAYAGLSLSWFNEWSCQSWEHFDRNGQLAYEYAHRALGLDDSDPMLHLVIGRVLLYRRAFEQASWYFDRALALCPNDAETLIQLAICEVFLGRPETGIERAGKAMRLNPYHPNYYFAYAALPHFAARDFSRALEIGGRAVDVPIIDLPAYTAVALAHLGRMDEAARRLAIYHAEFRKRIVPDREPEPGEACRWLLTVNPYRRQQDVDLLVEGFRLLGDGSARTTDRVTSAVCGTPDETGPALIRQGDSWHVAFAGQCALLPDLKGLHDIFRLLERPCDEIHCLDLAGRTDDHYAGEMALDDRARQELKARIHELRDELTEADGMNDIGRAEQLRDEMDQLVETLSRALGLGGRSRRLGSLSERARSAVTWRIRHAIRKIETVHQPLARHLVNALRTGTFCCYRPEQPISWRLKGAPRER